MPIASFKSCVYCVGSDFGWTEVDAEAELGNLKISDGCLWFWSEQDWRLASCPELSLTVVSGDRDGIVFLSVVVGSEYS
jgi:hypothetical protein